MTIDNTAGNQEHCLPFTVPNGAVTPREGKGGPQVDERRNDRRRVRPLDQGRRGQGAVLAEFAKARVVRRTIRLIIERALVGRPRQLSLFEQDRRPGRRGREPDDEEGPRLAARRS
jgi:hypothetical protein